jgi:lipopolysaccharide transport system ATP-binding protein
MYVRLAFAVAAHLEPEILVIDEVLAVGDAEFQNKCLDKMQDVSRSGRTILFVSHNLAAVNALCDRAIVLRAGCIDFDGVASKASEHYMAGILSDREHGSQKNGHIVRGNGFTIHAPNVDFVKNANNESDFLLTFEVEADEPRTYIRFGVALKTVTGILIARLSHRVTKFVIRRIEDRIRIQIRFKEISRYLAGGHYVLDAWLSVPDAEILLFAEGIAELHLPPGDPFGVGGEFKYPKSGLVPLPASFDLLDENSSHP